MREVGVGNGRSGDQGERTRTRSKELGRFGEGAMAKR